jgi:lipopolysaccharide transport system permease protein/teichoic acid transport system permease protein
MVVVDQFVDFLKDLVRSREILFTMTRRDFSDRYLGSYLGLLWAFIHPLASIVVLWVVFQLGFKCRPVSGCPFILWLASGMIPWLFLSEAISRAASSILDRTFLVKKVCFRTSMLPIVSIGSVLLIHLFFLVVLLGMFGAYRRCPDVCVLQLPYYLGASLFLLLGVSWITSSLSVFLRDVPQVITLLLQFAFWGTPVFWSLDMMPESLRGWLKLNPAMYLVEGYRDALIHKVWFWQHPDTTLYFWLFATACFVTGALMFRRLRPHFADVL